MARGVLSPWWWWDKSACADILHDAAAGRHVWHLHDAGVVLRDAAEWTAHATQQACEIRARIARVHAGWLPHAAVERLRRLGVGGIPDPGAQGWEEIHDSLKCFRGSGAPAFTKS